MKKFLIPLILALGLTGCTTTTVTRFVYVTYDVPKEYRVCPQLKPTDIPNPETLTDEEISQTIRKLFNYLQRCNANNKALNEFIDKANALAQERNQRKVK